MGEKKKKFNYYALFFHPFYYAGKGKLNMGIFLGIFGMIPFMYLLLGIVSGFRVQKEKLNEGFNWKYAFFVFLICFLIRLSLRIYMQHSAPYLFD